ncbi:MAG: RCC1 domain-containing protein, partial [Gemmatimonadota bacterium]
TRTQTTTAGAASFTGVWLDRAGSGYTLTVELPGATADTSATFDITPAAATGLGVITQPDTGEVGAELLLAVAVQDEFGNTVSDTTATIRLSFGPDPGSAVLSGRLEETTTAGVATFDSVLIDLPGSYTLDAAATGVALWQVRSRPIDLSLTFASVYAGQQYSCGHTVAQRVYCWGESRDGTTSYFVTPYPIQNDGGNRYTELTLSDQWGASAVTASGDWQYFFDANRSFQPGDVNVGAPVSRPGSGSRHHCAIGDAGDAYCYGWNTSGQLGNGDTTRAVYENAPVPVSGGIAFSRVDGGYDHTCGLDEFGAAFCWGSSAYGQLGAGGAASETECLGPPCSLTPIAVVGQHTFQSIAVGDLHTCGLTTGGELYCWGRNTDGQLGSAAGDSSSAPVRVNDPASGPVTWVAVSGGAAYTCGVTDTGSAYCWGNNPDGQLGIGTTGGSYTTPHPVAGELSFAGIDGGVSHTCAWTAAGQAYCWGSNSRGQLGDGTGGDSAEPVPVIQ